MTKILQFSGHPPRILHPPPSSWWRPPSSPPPKGSGSFSFPRRIVVFASFTILGDGCGSVIFCIHPPSPSSPLPPPTLIQSIPSTGATACLHCPPRLCLQGPSLRRKPWCSLMCPLPPPCGCGGVPLRGCITFSQCVSMCLKVSQSVALCLKVSQSVSVGITVRIIAWALDKDITNVQRMQKTRPFRWLELSTKWKYEISARDLRKPFRDF